MGSHLRHLFSTWIFMIIHAQVIHSQSTPAPAFLEEPADQEVNPGDSVDLKCRLNQPVTAVNWLKDGIIQNTHSGVYSTIGDPALNENTVRISGITVDRDDGVWECQALVPGSAASLGSRKAKLVVRQAPRDRPVLQTGEKPLRNGDEMQVRSDLNASVTCISREANPPATIKWWIGTKDITENFQTVNEKGPNSKLYNTVSTLTYQFMPEDNSDQLKCEITHPALAGSLTTYAHLNVLYAPIMTISQDPQGDIVEGQDVTLTCVAPANPPSQVKWSQNGRELPMINGSSILLEKVTHEANGNYSCIARNAGFDPVRKVFELSVRYAPSFLINPQSATVDVDQPLSFHCEAEGNPQPSIQWLQNTTDGQTIQRSSERNLTINADYSSQGKYWCRASNTINDKENIVLSDVAELLVKGPPKFEAIGGNQRTEITADKNSDGILAVTYCSQPAPVQQYWQKEQRGNDKQKQSSPITSSSKKYETSTRELQRAGCYESKLKVLQLDSSDAGRYKFWVENEKGPNAITLLLNVKDTNYTPVIVGVVVGVGSALILGLVAAICCYRYKRFCFATKKSFQNVDIEKREVKQENGDLPIRPGHKDDNLKQNPLQTESIFSKSDKKFNGNHVNMNGNGDLSKKNGRSIDGMPAEGLHYAQLDLPNTQMENGHLNGQHGTPRMERGERTEYTDIRPTVL